jgi:hypothetical protein
MPTAAALEGMAAQLTAMGFTREQAMASLREAKYEVTAAADKLLG